MDKETIVRFLEDTVNVLLSEERYEGICVTLSAQILAWESNNGIAPRGLGFMSDVVTDYIPEFVPETFGITEIIYLGKKRNLKDLSENQKKSAYWWPLDGEGLQHRVDALKCLIEKYK